MKKELFAFSMVLLVLVAFPASLFAYQAWRTNPAGVRVIDLVGKSPANGGWQPDTIRVNLGERVRLRISSTDVVHGFEIPALGIKVDGILPGHVEEVEFTATRAGRFPFACTRWCSPDHWRMRGVVEVVDASVSDNLAPTVAPPRYQQLKLDLDAPHPAQNVPAERPSAARGALLNLTISEDPRTQSPSDVFTRLRAAPAFQGYDDQQLWDAIAFAYLERVGDKGLKHGEQLFAQDCAACHGETGQGNGTAGLNLPGLTAIYPDGKRGPADFTIAGKMLGASDALLQGKVLRGGMGTGMPEWGSLYTEQDMWDVIGYIRTFIYKR